MDDADTTASRGSAVVSETDRKGKPLRTVIDMDTGLVHNDPIPSDEELAIFYARDYRTAYKGAATPRRRQILRNFRRAAEHVRAFRDVIVPARRVLDAGAGSGEFAYLMARLGKDIVGIEPNTGYADYCREQLGLDIRTAHLAPHLFETGSFDLIRLNHVLEHLNDPQRYLAMLARWLAPGGLLYVEVPNIESYARQKSVGNMFHYGHIWNFNPATLRMVAGQAGLVEAGATAARCAETTGAFFTPGSASSTVTANAENAERVKALIDAHYAGRFREGKRRKPLVKLAARIEETLTGALSGSPRRIGERVARSL